MGKTYKDNPNKWRKHIGWKPKSGKPKPLPPKEPLPQEKFDPYWNHH